LALTNISYYAEKAIEHYPSEWKINNDIIYFHIYTGNLKPNQNPQKLVPNYLTELLKAIFPTDFIYVLDFHYLRNKKNLVDFCKNNKLRYNIFKTNKLNIYFSISIILENTLFLEQLLELLSPEDNLFLRIIDKKESSLNLFNTILFPNEKPYLEGIVSSYAVIFFALISFDIEVVSSKLKEDIVREKILMISQRLGFECTA
jgi:hypothetical protein